MGHGFLRRHGTEGALKTKKPTSWCSRWVVSEKNEPSGRHPYGFDHHHCVFKPVRFM